MLDRYEIHQGPQTVAVTEKRAPTDDSIRLYREMLEKARAEIRESFRLENTLLNARVMRVHDPMTLSERVVVAFDLNGQRFDVDVKIPWANAWASPRVFEETIAKILSAAIAEQMIRAARSASAVQPR